MLKVYCEISPYNFLMNESWNCESLKHAVTDNNISDKIFDDAIESMLCSEFINKLALNDFLRFNDDDILEALGINE